MSVPMTKLEGVPNKSDMRPGMAYFCGTGPAGTTCGGCKHRGYTRESARGRWDERSGNMIYNHYRVTKCAVFKRMSGKHGADIDRAYPSCKYFEAAPK